VLILSAANVRELVPMAEAIRLMGVAFAELSAGRAQSPLRTPLPDAERGAVSLYMPAAVPALGGLGLKVVSVYPTNAARGLPTILALVTLLDAETGQPLAILDGTFLTALRTGAVSGKATDCWPARTPGRCSASARGRRHSPRSGRLAPRDRGSSGS
jgi:ornithine cyclodeaminase